MTLYHWFAIGALAICLASLIYHFLRVVNKGKPVDYSKQMGNIGDAIKYAYTGAMSPTKKESAYLYLPTYTAGMLYHVGTFLSILLFFLLLFNYFPGGWINLVIAGFLVITGLSGLAIFIKRIIKQELRGLSNPDDFFSNLLVTAFQFVTAFVFYLGYTIPAYFILIGVLLLYLPLGKLKHTVYFFTARYHLGFFYGWRGVWPPK
jgi:hypothetical protein